MYLSVLLISCFIGSVFPSTTNDPGALDIAAFNVQMFGVSKMKKPMVKNYLTKIILRYDLILIQEIRDKAGKSIESLLDHVNKRQPADDKYELVISERLGRTSSKEQYAFIYRQKWLSLVDSYVYDDVNDDFEREPFVVKFNSSLASIDEFAVAGIHTSPKDANKEINHLADVYDDIVNKFNTQDVVIMGDFNAGCTYVKSWRRIKLATDNRFYWLIDNKEDTTTKASDCAYDRVVVAGNNILSSIIPESIGVFRYDVHYGLNYKQTIKISDHFPVHFQISSKKEKENEHSSLEITSDDETNNELELDIMATVKSTATDLTKYTLQEFVSTDRSVQDFIISRSLTGMTSTINSLQDDFLKDFSNVVSSTEVYSLIRKLVNLDPLKYLARGYGFYKTLYDYQKNISRTFEARLVCRTETTLSCHLTVKEA